MANLSYIFWAFFLLILLQPYIKQRMLNASRIQLIKSLERKRNSRVITLIHRQELRSFLGILFGRFIDIEDSEEILRAIRFTDPKIPIDLILHTPGGLALAAEQIARAISKHKGKVTVFVPHYAASGGTLIALGADEIVMDPNAVLGPVDPQVGNFPAVSILKILKEKDKNKIDDQTLILADVAEKAIQQIRDYTMDLLKDKKLSSQQKEKIIDDLTGGKYTHDYPINVEALKKMGLNVSLDMPKEIYRLMSLYPQAGQQRPSVQYIPIPYQPPTPKK